VVDPARVESVASLSDLPEPAKRALAEEFDEVEVPAGERIVSQGDFAYELFAILEGKVRVEQDGDVIATLGPGVRLSSKHPEFADLIRSQSRGRFTGPAAR
jgi:hypothetical protein